MKSSICLRGLWLALFFFLFSQFCFGGYPWHEHGANGGVKLEINLEKTEYLVGEPIWLDLKATNITDREIRFLPLELYNADWFGVTIVNSNRDTLDYLGDKASYGTYLHGIPFAQGEVYFNFVNLVSPECQFGKLKDIDRSNPAPIALKEDTYSIQAVYLGNSSNRLEFRTINPIGDEKEAYELLKLGYKYMPIRTVDRSIENFKALIERFPNSVYAPTACYHLSKIFRVMKQDSASAENYAKLLVSRYPNSGYVSNAMCDLPEYMKEQELIEWLREAESKFPNTRAALKAKEIMQSLSKKCHNE